jgi:twitching motility protein PilT
MNIQHLLVQCVSRHASDLHLSSGVSAMLRVDGDLVALSDEVLTHDDIHAALMSIMSSAQQSNFKQNME